MVKRWLKSPLFQIALWLGAYALVGLYFGKFAWVASETSPCLGEG